MSSISTPSRSPCLLILDALVMFDVVALFFAGIVHLVGARIVVGSVVFDEQAILPAGVVETAAGVLFLWAAYELLTGGGRRWTAALVAHIFAIVGFLVGLFATREGTTPFNYTYHRVMLVLFVIGLVLLFIPAVRTSLRGRSSVH